jgi:hypothetical protein
MLLILDFKLSLCSVLTVSTFGCIPSVWFILADVSHPSVRLLIVINCYNLDYTLFLKINKFIQQSKMSYL